jgi:hypothetical protein
MALGRAVCTGDTINCCDAHLTSAMGQKHALPRRSITVCFALKVP